jgi:hypothetical protein
VAYTGKSNNIYTVFARCGQLVRGVALTRVLPDGRFSFEADTSYDAGVVARCLVRHGFAFDYAWGDQNFAPVVAETGEKDTDASASPR